MRLFRLVKLYKLKTGEIKIPFGGYVLIAIKYLKNKL